jgi:hypothetical protein
VLSPSLLHASGIPSCFAQSCRCSLAVIGRGNAGSVHLSLRWRLRPGEGSWNCLAGCQQDGSQVFWLLPPCVPAWAMKSSRKQWGQREVEADVVLAQGWQTQGRSLVLIHI